MPPRCNYPAIFEEIFGSVAVGERIAYLDVVNDPRLPATVAIATKKTHLKRYIEENPSQLKLLTGLIPKPETVIHLVESEIGGITEHKLDDANRKCSEVVTAITRPMVEGFIREGLSNYFEAGDSSYSVTASALSQFLLDDFAGYLKAAGNGLVSIAGALNEKLLQRALINAGMSPEGDFSITGTDSEADIVIHTVAGSRENLGVEVKSYHARERLLRGLKDVKEPKVGVGYFKDHSEFNHGRTITLLQARPAAIYMPQRTLDRVEQRARLVMTNERVAFGSALYRPLEQFASDMKHYAATGELPRYDGC